MGVFNNVISKVKSSKPVKKLFNGYYSQIYMIPPNFNTMDYLRTYGESGWLFACVSTIAKNIADSEWKAYKPDSDGEDQVISNNDIINLLEHPNPFLSQYEFMELHQMYLDLVGKCYWYVAKDKLGRPKELWLISPLDMIVIPDKNDYIKGYIYQAGTDQVPLAPDEVIMFTYPSPINPYDGISPAKAVSNAIQTDKFAGQWNRNFFYNNAEPQGLLHVPDDIDDDDYDRLVAAWNDRYGGVDNAKRTAIVRGGEGKVNYTAIQISQKDMDFFNLKIQSRDEVLGVYGVPKSILGITEDVNRANAETSEYTMAKHVIKPRLRRIQDKINNELVPMFKGLQGIQIKFTDPVPENKDFISNLLNTQVNKLISVNEGRQIMNKLLGTKLTDLPGGDEILVQSGLVPLSAVSSMAEMGLQTQQTTLNNLKNPPQPQEQQTPEDNEDDKQRDTTPTNAAPSKDDNGKSPKVDDEKKSLLVKLVTKQIQKQLKVKKLAKKISAIDKAKYLQEFHTKVEEQEIELKEVWSKVFQKQMDSVLTALKGKKGIYTKDLQDDIQRAIDTATTVEALKETVIPLLRKYLSEHAQDMLDLLETNMTFDLHDEKVTELLDTYCGDQITQINTTTKELVKQQMVEGELAGESIPELSNRIKTVMGEMKEYRAQRIARTEVIGASNQGKLFGMQNSGVVDYKEWLTAIDGREREWHAEANGQTVKINETFKVMGEDISGPGNGSAENVINCRCTVLPAFPN